MHASAMERERYWTKRKLFYSVAFLHIKSVHAATVAAMPDCYRIVSVNTSARR